MTGTIGIEEIANGTETTLEEDQSKRMYDDCVKPRIDDKDYSKVFVALAFNPELKKHLFQTEESLAMYNFVEKELKEIYKVVSEYQEKLKGLEGKSSERAWDVGS
ncbi:MAG: hypothetical protein WC511_05220 [Candidatus Pacearchaeota archaeon]